jgi:hypothetical protein
MALPTRRGNEGSSRSSEVEAPASGVPRTVPLTVKLRGRPEAPTKRRGRTLSSRARGANTQAFHGPLQRLLEAMLGNERNIQPNLRRDQHCCPWDNAIASDHAIVGVCSNYVHWNRSPVEIVCMEFSGRLSRAVGSTQL